MNNTSVLAVRFSDLGVSGRLELSFYNKRLMVAQFEPDDPGRYWDLLSAHLGKLLPQAANQTGQINKDVTLSWYGDYSESGAKTRFRWGYLPVPKDWQTGLAKPHQPYGVTVSTVEPQIAPVHAWIVVDPTATP